MFNGITTTGLTLGKVISGISKSLNVVNQLIPLYREVKPVINNVKTVLGTMKEVSNANTNKDIKNHITETKIIKKDISTIGNISNNNPVFFN